MKTNFFIRYCPCRHWLKAVFAIDVSALKVVWLDVLSLAAAAMSSVVCRAPEEASAWYAV
jgi:hypothetical protein